MPLRSESEMQFRSSMRLRSKSWDIPTSRDSTEVRKPRLVGKPCILLPERSN